MEKTLQVTNITSETLSDQFSLKFEIEAKNFGISDENYQKLIKFSNTVHFYERPHKLQVVFRFNTITSFEDFKLLYVHRLDDWIKEVLSEQKTLEKKADNFLNYSKGYFGL